MHQGVYWIAGFLLSMVGPLTAEAQHASETHPWLTARFLADIGYAFAGQDTSVSVDSKLLTRPGLRINLEEDLTLNDSEGSVSGSFKWRFGEKWSVSGQYFGANRKARNLLERDVEWEDQVFQAGAEVSGGFKYDIYRVLFGRRVSTGDHHELGIGVGAHWMDLSTFIAGEAFIDDVPQGMVENNASVSAPLPNLGAWYTWAWNERWAFNARVDWLDASVGDYSGLLLNSGIALGWQVSERVGLVVQYNYFNLEVEVDDADWRGDVDAQWDGPYLGLSFNW